jgi:hypothetical protein
LSCIRLFFQENLDWSFLLLYLFFFIYTLPFRKTNNVWLGEFHKGKDGKTLLHSNVKFYPSP